MLATVRKLDLSLSTTSSSKRRALSLEASQNPFPPFHEGLADVVGELRELGALPGERPPAGPAPDQPA